MPKLNQTHIALLLLLSVVVAGAALFILQSNRAQQAKNASEIFSVAGNVASVDQARNAFTMLQLSDGQLFSVRLGEETDLNRIVPPFDMAKPPKEATFTLEKESAAMKDIKEGDQVFVRSSRAIGQDRKIVNPLEVQILP